MRVNRFNRRQEEGFIQYDRSTRLAFVALVFLASNILGSSAFAETAASACSFLTGSKQRNCVSLFDQIPNKNALTYALNFFEHNRGKLADSGCVRGNKSVTRHGIKNQCQFVINDMSSRISGFPLKAHAYMVDLCATSPSKVVRKYKVNVGTGKGYGDVNGGHTTSLGAFLTDDHTREFVPYRYNAAYRTLKHQLGGHIPALDLIGLQSTNNDTDSSKPMHVSPYKSSWGCPSIGKEDLAVIRALAKGGPSLVINYASPALNPESSVMKCDAIRETRTSNPIRSVRRIHGKTHYRYAKHHHYRNARPSWSQAQAGARQ